MFISSQSQLRNLKSNAQVTAVTIQSYEQMKFQYLSPLSLCPFCGIEQSPLQKADQVFALQFNLRDRVYTSTNAIQLHVFGKNRWYVPCSQWTIEPCPPTPCKSHNLQQHSHQLPQLLYLTSPPSWSNCTFLVASVTHQPHNHHNLIAIFLT